MRSNTILVLFAAVAWFDGCSGSIGESARVDPANGSGTGSATTGAGGSTGSGSATGSGTGGPSDAAASVFRLLAPMSTSTVTSQQPLLRWDLGSDAYGAKVEVCRDHACSTIVASSDLDGAAWLVRSGLEPGTYYWHAYPRTGLGKSSTPTPTWQFMVPERTPLRPEMVGDVNTSWGTTLDVNLDGYADLMIGAAYNATGRAYFYPGGTAGLPANPAATLTNPDGVPSNFGMSVASAGDVNGDGYPDVVIGAPAADDNAGRAYIYFGGPSGPPSDPSATLRRPKGDGTRFGGCVASAGDVNGDGHADILVGAASTVGNNDATSGMVYLYLGGPSGPASTPDLTLVDPDGKGTFFGSSAASAGDVNGDGFADVLIGSYGANGLAGKAYVYLGGISGLSSSPSWAHAGAEQTGAAFGISVASAGDVNGDGYADIAVGAAALSTGSAGAELNGRAYIYEGSSSGLSPSPKATLTGPIFERFGVSVASAGDVNRDGYSDVVVGASSGGKAYLYLGGAGGLAVAEAVVFSADTPGGFGISVAGAGDTDGNGSSDIVVGAYKWGNSAGRAYVYLGGSSGPSSRPQLEIASPGGDFGAFGISVASVHSRSRSRVRFQ